MISSLYESSTETIFLVRVHTNYYLVLISSNNAYHLSTAIFIVISKNLF